jgi:hypothetical protein
LQALRRVRCWLLSQKLGHSKLLPGLVEHFAALNRPSFARPHFGK